MRQMSTGIININECVQKVTNEIPTKIKKSDGNVTKMDQTENGNGCEIGVKTCYKWGKSPN